MSRKSALARWGDNSGKKMCAGCLAKLGYGCTTISKSLFVGSKVTVSRWRLELRIPASNQKIKGNRIRNASNRPKQSDYFPHGMRINNMIVESKAFFTSGGLTRKERRLKAYRSTYDRERIRAAERYKNDPEYRVYHRCKSILNKCMRRTRIGMRTEPAFGCSQEELIAHIQSQFMRGMSWGNYGHKQGCWEIDHIEPCNSFNFNDPEQVLRANHFTNLRPLWVGDNRSKSDKFSHEDRLALETNRKRYKIDRFFPEKSSTGVPCDQLSASVVA